MKIINLTPHSIVVEGHTEAFSQPITFPASGDVARILQTEKSEEPLFVQQQYELLFNIRSLTTSDIEGLPAPEAGVSYLVSAMVLAEAKVLGRTDCIAPDTAAATRNEKGHIISVPGFVA